jgi:hypothetical protein
VRQIFPTRLKHNVDWFRSMPEALRENEPQPMRGNAGRAIRARLRCAGSRCPPTVTNMSLDTGENARALFDRKHMTDAVNQGGYVHAMSGAIRISLTYR